MIVLPAIDIIDGKAVRLTKGAYDQKKVYSEDPHQVAKSFENQGADHLHIVDLDGAKEGQTRNFSVIEKIVSKTNLKVEVGGGIRDEETIQAYLDIGVHRIILGTAAVKNLDFLEEMLGKFSDAIAVGVDIKDGYVATEAWQESSEYTGAEFCQILDDMGVRTVICTDISKDGMLAGSNIDLYQSLVEKYEMNFIASGGVSSLEEIDQLKRMGIYGTIIGKALYEGKVDLAEAIKASKWI